MIHWCLQIAIKMLNKPKLNLKKNGKKVGLCNHNLTLQFTSSVKKSGKQPPAFLWYYW